MWRYFNLCFSYLCIQKGKPVELVDIPGDERVRDRLFSKYKNSLRYVYSMINISSLVIRQIQIVSLFVVNLKRFSIGTFSFG